MKEYLKMSDVFKVEIYYDGDENQFGLFDGPENSFQLADFYNKDECQYAAHAINSHDELVEEVERLRGMVQDAFIDGCHAGWDMSCEGYNAEYGGPDDGAMHDMFVTKSMEYNKGA